MSNGGAQKIQSVAPEGTTFQFNLPEEQAPASKSLQEMLLAKKAQKTQPQPAAEEA